MANTIDMTVEVSDEFLRDIMTNTVETGALGGWASVRHVMRDKGLNVLSFEVADVEDLHEREEEARRIEDKDEAEAAINDKATLNALYNRITKDTLLVGLRLLLTNDVFVADDIRSAIYTGVVEDDAANIDAIGCDVIVQAGLFNDIVFG